ncbi:DUF2714 domain-containing protein [Metamycoplasma phocicerebrale]|uniref:DUF2714 domain-containing protein n=1 Tax=Metamycoplasma phocicerebrale TaxID=142649 RepID=A0A3T0TUP4_9BACT|nr:DUF2714 domain-containing protein [Metamycoplasma phocicerebrale]AZZ65768.1 DUF2714 domain-containing protein [Metamycoplasma phocicerebrale]
MKKNNNERKNLIESLKEIEKMNNIYETLQDNNKFISFYKLISTVNLKSFNGLQNSYTDELIKKIEDALINRFDVIYDNFIIKYKLSKKLNDYFLVPTLENAITTNFESIDLRSKNATLNKKTLEILNLEIKNLLSNGFVVEIMSGIAIRLRQKLEIYFSKKNVIRW